MVHAQTIFAVVAFTFGATSLTVLAVPLPPSETEAVTETGGDVLASVTMSHKPAIEEQDMFVSGADPDKHIERRQEISSWESPATSPAKYNSPPSYPVDPSSPTGKSGGWRDSFLARVSAFKQKASSSVLQAWNSQRMQGLRNHAVTYTNRYISPNSNPNTGPAPHNRKKRPVTLWDRYRSANHGWGDDVLRSKTFNEWATGTASGQAFAKELNELPYESRSGFGDSARRAFLDKHREVTYRNNYPGQY
ncbi:hypothetical protein C8R42DRAFT_688294 [Lentinula raphanica]|nr:hypothetical protein C8R42DRAFT_688294 [Lentinula raphanica]